MIKIIDTFKGYKSIIEENLHKAVEDKLSLWEEYYHNNYEEIEKKCKEDYEAEGYDWREIGLTKVFNRVEEDYPYMVKAYENIEKILDRIDERVKEIFDIDIDINIVIYAGLGTAAGWVTEYEGKRAILFGIDKIAELRWETIEQLNSLVCHELCHVVHFDIRGEVIPTWAESNKYNYSLWNIYEEGFAQYFQEILGNSTVDSRGEGWALQCKAKEREVKDLYLEALKDEVKGAKDFYGDWFKVLGISDVGYYLGAKLIGELHENYDVRYIATMSTREIEKKVLEFLNR